MSSSQPKYFAERTRVRTSLRTHGLRGVRVTAHHIHGNVTYYNLMCKNRLLRWEMEIRFDRFSQFHEEMWRLWEIRSTASLRLPPFPEKRSKLFVDHLDPHFIRAREALLDNYLRSLFHNKTWRSSKPFLAFCVPGDHVFSCSVEERKQKTDEKESSKDENETDLDSKDDGFDADSSDEVQDGVLDDDDDPPEFTDVKIIQAQILRGDHVIYQVDVSNSLKSEPHSSWVVLKRYLEFNELDVQVRAHVQHKYPRLLPKIPKLPAREVKIFINHLDPTFIERRRVLLELYLKVLITIPKVRTMPEVMEFLGV